MQQQGEVKVYWDTLEDGRRVIRVSAKHIPEELRNELVKILGGMGEYLKVVAECDSKLVSSLK